MNNPQTFFTIRHIYGAVETDAPIYTTRLEAEQSIQNQENLVVVEIIKEATK